MTDEERQVEIADVRNKLRLLPHVDLPRVDDGPYEADTTEGTDTSEQVADPTPVVSVSSVMSAS